MNSQESVVKEHFNFIVNFVDLLIQKNIEIVQYRYDGYAFGSWYLDIVYNDVFRRFVYDGRDDSLEVVDNKDRRFADTKKSNKVFYKILTDEKKNNLLAIVKDLV